MVAAYSHVLFTEVPRTEVLGSSHQAAVSGHYVKRFVPEHSYGQERTGILRGSGPSSAPYSPKCLKEPRSRTRAPRAELHQGPKPPSTWSTIRVRVNSTTWKRIPTRKRRLRDTEFLRCLRPAREGMAGTEPLSNIPTIDEYNSRHGSSKEVAVSAEASRCPRCRGCMPARRVQPGEG